MGKFFFVIFLQENFGVQFLPEGSPPQWEGGRPQHNMCSWPVYCLFAKMFSWGRSGNF